MARLHDSEDSTRFYALRLHEAGLIKSSPQKIITDGADWRFLNELKRELKGVSRPRPREERRRWRRIDGSAMRQCGHGRTGGPSPRHRPCQNWVVFVPHVVNRRQSSRHGRSGGNGCGPMPSASDIPLPPPCRGRCRHCAPMERSRCRRSKSSLRRGMAPRRAASQGLQGAAHLRAVTVERVVGALRRKTHEVNVLAEHWPDEGHLHHHPLDRIEPGDRVLWYCASRAFWIARRRRIAKASQ